MRKAIAENDSGEDLYYRLSMVEIHVPSLDERKEDVPLLTRFLLERFSKQFHKEIRGLTQRAQIVISRHHWPGNVRELENVLGHGCMMAVGNMIDVQDPAGLYAVPAARRACTGGQPRSQRTKPPSTITKSA